MQLLFLLLAVSFVSGDYWTDREQFIKNEESLSFGNKIKLSPIEEQVNNLLMIEKKKELDKGFVNPETFLPSLHFFLAKEKIHRSPVFKFIKKMPKGGALHVHELSFASLEYVLYNITYRDHLLICQKENELKMAFADPPPKDDCWKLLKTLREQSTNVKDFDNWLKSKLTLETDKPLEEYPDMHAVWKKFQDILDIDVMMCSYKPVFEDYFYRALEEFYEDNVNYIEIRGILPLVYNLNGWPLNPIQVLDLLQNTAKIFLQNHPGFLGIKYIYTANRKSNDETMSEYIQIFKMMKQKYPNFLAGFDIAGQEDLGRPLTEFINNLNNSNIKFFFHAGETNWNGMPTDMNLIDAILLNTTRIGHGFAILKHPAILEEVRKRNIAIEVCPVSHQVLNLIKDLRNHPASFLFAEDYPVVLSSDNPGLWGATGLSYDFYEAFMGIVKSTDDLRMLKQLALNSLEYSSMEPEEKKIAIDRFLEKWNKFIEDILENGF